MGRVGRTRARGGALAGQKHGTATAARQGAHDVRAGERQVMQRGSSDLPQLQRKLDQAQCAGRGLRMSGCALCRRQRQRPAAGRQQTGRHSSDLDVGRGKKFFVRKIAPGSLEVFQT